MIVAIDDEDSVIMVCTGGTDSTHMVSGSLNCALGPRLMVGIPPRC